jgi:hypothetical protein
VLIRIEEREESIGQVPELAREGGRAALSLIPALREVSGQKTTQCAAAGRLIRHRWNSNGVSCLWLCNVCNASRVSSGETVVRVSILCLSTWILVEDKEDDDDVG